MKFHIDHIKNLIDSDIQTKELSEKLFQLGHENTVSNNIIDIEFTPNRGDCLSITGLVRDLSPFYGIKNLDIYNDNIGNWDFNFENKL
jgi:phenylalanyl-tRNA synthetase beta subunit